MLVHGLCKELLYSLGNDASLETDVLAGSYCCERLALPLIRLTLVLNASFVPTLSRELPECVIFQKY